MIPSIKLEGIQYFLEISAVSSNAGNVTGAAEIPAISGVMQACANLLETYNKMSEMLSSYSSLLYQDAEQLKSSGDSMIEAEKNLLE